VLAALPRDLPPAKVYADQLGSYASNEIAINWQASLVFLLAENCSNFRAGFGGLTDWMIRGEARGAQCGVSALPHGCAPGLDRPQGSRASSAACGERQCGRRKLRVPHATSRFLISYHRCLPIEHGAIGLLGFKTRIAEHAELLSRRQRDALYMLGISNASGMFDISAPCCWCTGCFIYG